MCGAFAAEESITPPRATRVRLLSVLVNRPKSCTCIPTYISDTA